MARCEHLPVSEKAMAFPVYFEQSVRPFSRYRRYTIGLRLRESAWSVLKLILLPITARLMAAGQRSVSSISDRAPEF